MFEALVLLLFALAIVSLFQPTDERFYTACLYSGAAILHFALFMNAEDLAYYGTAALFDLGVIFFPDMSF